MGNIADIYGGAYDTSQPDAADGSSSAPLPAGWYPLQVDEAEIKETKAKTGKYLHLEMTVLESDKGGTGKKLFPNINLVNPTQAAVEIGQRELAALGKACGLTALDSTDELLSKVVMGRLKVTKATDEYPADNVVTAYKAVEGMGADPAPATVTNTTVPPTTTPAAPAAGEAQRPWEKKK